MTLLVTNINITYCLIWVRKGTRNITGWGYSLSCRKTCEIMHLFIKNCLNDGMDNFVLNGSEHGKWPGYRKFVFSSDQNWKKLRISLSPVYEIIRVGKNVLQCFSILGDRDLTQPVSILPEKEKPKTYNCFPMSRLCFGTDNRIQNMASNRLILCPASSCLFVTISLSNFNCMLHVFPQALTILVLSSMKHNLYYIVLYIT
jgi:hypothetical protein